jgi:hypothetical protein
MGVMPNSYETYQMALCLLGAVYAALFVMISNHFVFKPKVEGLFQHSSISSGALYQFLVDVLTNLSQLTFVATSLLVFADDNALSVMLYSDISWSGLFLGVVAFRGLRAREEPNSRLMLLKNVVFLGLGYAAVAIHYATG